LKLFSGLLSYSFYVSIIILTGTGCIKTDEEFAERKLTAVFEVPANLNPVETHYVYVRNIPSLYKQTLETRGWSTGRIKRISPSRARLYGRFGSTNVSIFSSVSVRIVSRDGKNTKSEMYFQEEIPVVARTELDLRPTLSDLMPIISQENFDLEIRLQIRGFIPVSLPLQLDFNYVAVLDK
jgi:hypothetical protein